MRQRALWVGEVEQTSTKPANCRQLEFAGADSLGEWLHEERACPRHRRFGIFDAQSKCADTRPMRYVGGVSKSLPLRVDHEIDSALSPQLHILGDVLGHLPETKRPEDFSELGAVLFVDGELDELDF